MASKNGLEFLKQVIKIMGDTKGVDKIMTKVSFYGNSLVQLIVVYNFPFIIQLYNQIVSDRLI